MYSDGFKICVYAVYLLYRMIFIQWNVYKKCKTLVGRQYLRTRIRHDISFII